MFDDVIIAVSDDERALDALALGRALASPGAALTLVHVEQGGADRETPQERHPPRSCRCPRDRAAPSIRSSSSAPRRPRPVCTTSRRAAARTCS